MGFLEELIISRSMALLRWACLMHLELIRVSCRYCDRISGNEQDSLQCAACKTIRQFPRHVQGSCLTSGLLPASSSSSASRVTHFLDCGQQLQLYDAPEGLILHKKAQGQVQQRAEP